MRKSLPIAGLAAAAATAALALPSAAAAAEPCPNAQYRTGPSLALPDCRAYEMVTPPDKYDQIQAWPLNPTAGSSAPPAFVSPSGDSLAYLVGSGKLADDPAMGVLGGWERGLRTAAGWRIEAAQAPVQGPFFAPAQSPAQWATFSDDVSMMAFTAGSPYSPLQQPSDGRREWFGAAHRTDGHTTDWLSQPTWAGALPAMNTSEATMGRWRVDGASSSLDTVYFSSQATHTELDDASGRPHHTAWAVYRWKDGELSNAAVLPDGTVSRGGSIPADHSAPVTDQSPSAANVEAKTANAISRDGRSLLFVSPDPRRAPADPTLPKPQLYLAREGEPTVLLSGAPDGPGSAVRTPVAGTQGLSLAGALGVSAVYHDIYALSNPSHSTVVFTTRDALTDDAPVDQPDVNKTYVYDVGADELTYLPEADQMLKSTTPTVSQPPGLINPRKGSLVALSPDGTQLLYLTPSGELRLWRRGASTLVVSADVTNDTSVPEQTAISAVRFRGDRLFMISHGPLGGETRHVGASPRRSHVYLYDVPSETVSCLSCKAGYETASGASFSNTAGNEFSMGATATVGTRPMRGVTASGDAVAFVSDIPLTANDHNAKRDVYLWKDGDLQLLSSGATGAADQVLYDITPDGRDVFILSREQLVPWDIDHLYDIYDVRVGGGFDPPAVAAPPCSGDECQGVVVPSGGEQPAPGSETATGAGNAEPARGAARLKVAQRRVGRAAVVAVRVSGPGRVRVAGRGVRTTAKRVGRSGRHRVVLRLRRNAARRLAARGRVATRVRVTFRARSGRRVTRRVTVRFKTRVGASRAPAAKAKGDRR
ncbi:MAG: hypothetical protein GXY03_01155 [Solirubrobacterales bacterium]|nr:hypothetical protein [Solirubrobacterales bacterium]